MPALTKIKHSLATYTDRFSERNEFIYLEISISFQSAVSNQCLTCKKKKTRHHFNIHYFWLLLPVGVSLVIFTWSICELSRGFIVCYCSEGKNWTQPVGLSWPTRGRGSALFTEISGFGLLLHVPRAHHAPIARTQNLSYWGTRCLKKSKLSTLPWGFFLKDNFKPPHFLPSNFWRMLHFMRVNILTSFSNSE